MSSNTYNTEKIIKAPKSRLIGKNIIIREVVESTSSFLKDALTRGEVSSGTIAVANIQTKGYGRFKRKWVSPRGGIYLSFLIKRFKRDIAPLTLVIAYSVANSLQYLTGIKPNLKWPNDILVNDKKIGGVLAELVGDNLVCGVGVNINTEQSALPEEIKERATSLFIETGKKFDITDALLNLIQGIDKNLVIYKNKGFSYFRDRWLSLCPRWHDIIYPKIGQEKTVHLFHDISETGALIIVDENGEKRLFSGEISYE